MKIFFIQLFLIILLVHRQFFADAQEVKVFSKYNYYTTENNVEILGEIPSAIKNKEYALNIFEDEKLIGSFHEKQNALIASLPLSSFKPGTTELGYTISGKENIIQK